MRALRTLLAGVLVAGALVALPTSATAAPRGALAESEYQVLLAAYDQSAALGEDVSSTEMRTICAAMAPRSTRLLAAEHAVCMGVVRFLDSGARFAKVDTTCGVDLDCFAREMLRLETSTRSLARLVRAERRAVAERRLTGACARAFSSGQSLTMLDGMAAGMRDMRRAILAGDVEGIERASRRVERATAKADDTSAADGLELLRRCPRA